MPPYRLQSPFGRGTFNRHLGDASSPRGFVGPAGVIVSNPGYGVAPSIAINSAQAQTRLGPMFSHPRPNYWEPPHKARTIETSSQPFVAMPAPGAAASTVLSYTVPNGYRGVIRWLAVVAIGGGFIDGTGNIIWRIRRNQTWVQGYENLTAQIGSWADPNPSLIEVQENETYTVTVEVPMGAPVSSASSGARFRGWLLPLNHPAGANGGQQ